MRKDISSETLGITETRRLYILQMLLASGLIAGFNIKIGQSGDFYISKGRPRLTLKGIE